MPSKLKSILKYSGVVYLSQILNILSIFVIPKFLQPVILGKFNLLQVFYGYMDYSNLAVRYGLEKELAGHLAKNQNIKAEYIAGNGIFGILAISFLVDLIVFTALILFSSSIDRDIFWGLFIICLSANVFSTFSSFKNVLRIKSEISKMGRAVFIYGILSTISRIAGVILFGFYGLIFGLLLANIAGLLIIIKIATLKIKLSFNFQRIKKFFIAGFPFFIYSFLFIFFKSMDKLVIAKFLGFKMLGYYAIANMLFGFLQILSGSINEIVFPDLLKKTSINYDKKAILAYLKNYTPLLSKLFAIIIGTVIIFIPFLINAFLPEYTPSIIPAQILILAAYPIAFHGLFSGYLYGTNNHKMLIFPIILSIIFFSLGIVYLKIINLVTLTSIAGLMVISIFISAYVIIYRVYTELNAMPKEIIANLSRSLVPLYCVVIAFALPYVFKYESINILQNFGILSLNEIIFILFALPLVLSLSKNQN